MVKINYFPSAITKSEIREWTTAELESDAPNLTSEQYWDLHADRMKENYNFYTKSKLSKGLIKTIHAKADKYRCFDIGVDRRALAGVIALVNGMRLHCEEVCILNGLVILVIGESKDVCYLHNLLKKNG